MLFFFYWQRATYSTDRDLFSLLRIGNSSSFPLISIRSHVGPSFIKVSHRASDNQTIPALAADIVARALSVSLSLRLETGNWDFIKTLTRDHHLVKQAMILLSLCWRWYITSLIDILQLDLIFIPSSPSIGNASTYSTYSLYYFLHLKSILLHWHLPHLPIVKKLLLPVTVLHIDLDNSRHHRGPTSHYRDVACSIIQWHSCSANVSTLLYCTSYSNKYLTLVVISHPNRTVVRTSWPAGLTLCGPRSPF